ncbi:hypothetical protein MJA45_21295 [Paenibacillus aurantius]|uniref:Uncharacterized protein n=1 Tax=Paenibacillus aurantius TaxID=2918900 RepID=A0AA96REG5_9BACL|nr:hypothetical protein [Paenibacillus aurantius]WNQ10138.1 hypothetical protein MJA45_21295 [Paenibacillus aurantius]
MGGSRTKRLLIKQATGRLLLEGEKLEGGFDLEEGDKGWKITLRGVEPALAGEIGRLLDELNVFYFEEGPDGQLSKWWLYDKERPDLQYAQEARTLQLSVDSRQAYTNQGV